MGDAAVNHPVVAAGGDAGQSSFPAAAGGFVALDVGALSSLAGDAGLPGTPTAPPRTPKVMRSLSRKGDRKPPPPDADANGTAGTSLQTISSLCLPSKSCLSGYLAT
ncbi:hypothetical protein SORBI_3002G324801 [Sorghum bicolor]|uniref:Uncharacterized protein n=1 Tax=Sorghum bicolor TaxID=4558 RepID=A0A1W0W6Q0_SORBI|nr:hypothetical protein SORBI_3002G324801 [Sorghum bicolor]OQU90042.1 hypothetical protein SORBI_3002G324801 [Sorghum bicolor]